MLGGAKSFVPLSWNYRGTGGTTSAEYCYAVWLRHMVLVHRCGLPTSPQTLVELGPGDSIGVGLMALLTGTQTYRALDVLPHASADRNLAILERLVPLLRSRAPIPDEQAMPQLYPRLDNYAFPADVLTEERLRHGLSDGNVAAVRRATESLRNGAPPDPRVQYICPWTDLSAVEPGTADMVLSHGVFQDMDDLPAAFRAMHLWLKPGGVMSHHSDFTCADKTIPWNEHWTYPAWQWRLIRGRRPYYINGQPLSTYLRLFEQFGFTVLKMTPMPGRGGVSRAQLAKRYAHVTDEDLRTQAAHIVAVKRQ
jgi:hypothetical protein